ncbi:MAG: hypothetical protein GY822_31780 [Deltaproteobacteria bacterium]|nr:hypothetical protein [Deltaproteobacteria bacterium]
MENDSDTYVLIDEPRPGALSRVVVSPTIVFLASMLVPIFYTLPLWGRLWMPFAWFAFNGVAMGSATLKREILISISGIFTVFAALFGLLFGGEFIGLNPELILPYVRLMTTGVIFFFMYWLSFLQQPSFQLFQYLKEER